MRSWIERRCAAHCTLRAALLAGPFLVSAYGVLFMLREGIDAFRGPHIIEAAELATLGERPEAEHGFVAVQCADARDTRIGTSRREDPKRYWAVPCGERVLLVWSSKPPSGVVRGALVRLGDDVRRLLAAGDRERVLPVYVADEDPRWALAVGLAITGFIAIQVGRRLFLATRWAADPSRHPVIVRVVEFGGIDAASYAIESELKSPKSVRFRGWVLGRRFAIDTRIGQFGVHPWLDLLWAYEGATVQWVWFVVPMRRRRAPILRFDGVDEIRLDACWTSGHEADDPPATDVIALAGERAPWAVIGYSEPVARDVEKRLDAFRAAVAARRDALLAGRSDAGSGRSPDSHRPALTDGP